MSWIGDLASALGGGLIGLLIALAALRRQPRVTAPALPDRALLAEVAFLASTTGYAVLDSDAHVLAYNPRAAELGVVRAGLIDSRIRDAVGRAKVAGEPIDVEIGVVEPVTDLGPRRNPASVQAVVRSTRSGYVLVAAADETEALRLEAVRRDFVANVSHELKTPVAAIGLLAEAVLDGFDDPEHVEKYGQKLLRESIRLGALVNELITLSRLQGADPLPDLAVLEVDAVVAEAHARSVALAETAGTTITMDAPSGLLVKGDRQMLITALVNLLANAVHYSPAANVVSISRRVNEGFVEIAVTDRGIGIAAEHQSRVFERFFRIDPARSRATGGTGLGLAIVKHVAANHGGAAVLWSKPGTGSTFTLRLPRFVPEGTAPVPTTAQGPSGPESVTAPTDATAAARKPSVPATAPTDTTATRKVSGSVPATAPTDTTATRKVSGSVPATAPTDTAATRKASGSVPATAPTDTAATRKASGSVPATAPTDTAATRKASGSVPATAPTDTAAIMKASGSVPATAPTDTAASMLAGHRGAQ